MVLLNKFCCFCDLRTGGIILGWLGMMIGIIQIVGLGIIIHFTEDIVDKINLNILLNLENLSDLLDYSTVYTIAFILIGINVIYLLSNTALLWGSHKGQHKLLLPWLITVPILSTIFVRAIFIIVHFLAFLPYTVLQIYFWFCVLSLYQRLRRYEEFPPLN